MYKTTTICAYETRIRLVPQAMIDNALTGGLEDKAATTADIASGKNSMKGKYDTPRSRLILIRINGNAKLSNSFIAAASSNNNINGVVMDMDEVPKTLYFSIR